MKRFIIAVLFLVVASTECFAKVDRKDPTVQVFAQYIDQHLYRWYKRGKERQDYIYKIAIAAAEIEEEDPFMGCAILAIAKKESDFRIRKNPKSNAKGLCQVIHKYHTKLLLANGIQEKDLLESPAKSIKAGYLVFKNYYKRCDSNFRKAIFKYRGYGSKGLSHERCLAYLADIEYEYAWLLMMIYG